MEDHDSEPIRADLNEYAVKRLFVTGRRFARADADGSWTIESSKREMRTAFSGVSPTTALCAFSSATVERHSR
jgi:hypothetical protein